MYRWRTPMSTTNSRSENAAARNGRIECTLHTDPRLIAAVGTIIADAARRAELSERAQEVLAAAVVETCHAMFPPSRSEGNSSGAIRVEVTDFPDRVEAVIEAADKLSPAGNSTDGVHKPLQDLNLERTRCEVQPGRVRLTLIKQCGEAKSSQTA